MKSDIISSYEIGISEGIYRAERTVFKKLEKFYQEGKSEIPLSALAGIYGDIQKLHFEKENYNE